MYAYPNNLLLKHLFNYYKIPFRRIEYIIKLKKDNYLLVKY